MFPQAVTVTGEDNATRKQMAVDAFQNNPDCTLIILKNNVNCYYFLGKNTIDEYMYDVIQRKKGIANGVTGTDDVVKENVIDMAMDLFKGRL